MGFETVVIPDGKLESLANELLAGEVDKHKRLMPLRVTGALYVARPTLVVRTVQTDAHTLVCIRLLVATELH